MMNPTIFLPILGAFLAAMMISSIQILSEVLPKLF